MTNTIEKISVGWFFYNPDNQNVLLHKRDDKAFESPNKWDYFGGSGEGEETAIQALMRELNEELSISIEQDKVNLLTDYLEGDRHKYIFYILSTYKKNELVLGEGADLEWFLFDEALKLDLTDDARKNLFRLKERVITGK